MGAIVRCSDRKLRKIEKNLKWKARLEMMKDNESNQVHSTVVQRVSDYLMLLKKWFVQFCRRNSVN